MSCFHALRKLCLKLQTKILISLFHMSYLQSLKCLKRFQNLAICSKQVQLSKFGTNRSFSKAQKRNFTINGVRLPKFVTTIHESVNRRPLAIGSFVAMLKGIACDLTAQGYEYNSDKNWKKYDLHRTVVFACFGFFYLGIVQYYFYSFLFTRHLTLNSLFHTYLAQTATGVCILFSMFRVYPMSLCPAFFLRNFAICFL